MKNPTILLFVLLPLLCKSQTDQNKNPENFHSSINVTGGDISSAAGSISYSIGQVYYSSYYGKKNYVTEGVQQPIIIYITPIDKIDKNEKELKVVSYPNPVVNHFRIEVASSIHRSLSYNLLDLTGRLVKAGQIGESGIKVVVSGLPAAIYLLKISDNGKLIKTIRIIKN